MNGAPAVRHRGAGESVTFGRRHPRALALAVALSAGLLVTGPRPVDAATGGPCEAEAYRALDGWIGEWRLVQGRRIVAESRITPVAQGCALEESWEALLPGGRLGTGRGWLYRDPADGSWHGLWVDSQGRVVRGRGEVVDGGLTLDAESLTAAGSSQALRIRFVADEDGRRHLLERPAADGGWTTFRELRYDAAAPESGEAAREDAASGPAGAPGSPQEHAAQPVPARPPPPRERRPQEPPDSDSEDEDGPAAARSEPSVRVLSGGIAADERVEMASPMVLEVPLGPLDAIPAGYAWRTTDTARFSVQGISVARLGVTKRARGEEVELTVSLLVRAERYLQRADLEVALLAPGEAAEPLATRTVPDVAVGLSVPSQMANGGVERTVTFELDRDLLADLFAGASPPALRLTVASD